MALNGLLCADVPLRNYSLTFKKTTESRTSAKCQTEVIEFWTEWAAMLKPRDAKGNQQQIGVGRAYRERAGIW